VPVSEHQRNDPEDPDEQSIGVQKDGIPRSGPAIAGIGVAGVSLAKSADAVMYAVERTGSLG